MLFKVVVQELQTIDPGFHQAMVIRADVKTARLTCFERKANIFVLGHCFESESIRLAVITVTYTGQFTNQHKTLQQTFVFVLFRL